MDLANFAEDLANTVRARAEVDNDFTSMAFLSEVAERLSDAEEIENLNTMQFAGVGSNRRKIAVNGYDLDDPDESIALAVLDFHDSDRETVTLTRTDANKTFRTLEQFLTEALAGSFQDGREESTPEYELAEALRRRGRAVSRYRLYLITNKVLSQAAKDFPAGAIGQIPVEYHVWDVGRLHALHQSALGREPLVIDLREWQPAGFPALRVANDRVDTTTYLCALPGRFLADLYGRYGSRLLEGNVRSFLTARGKINRGIKTTILSEPERFLAYNNGITATATAIVTDSDRIVEITDLQIVNGGQTTASLFYVNRENKTLPQFNEVAVQAKIVEVAPQIARELVPNISRYANSQNKVSEADLFSNSPFHVRMEELSRRLMTPTRAGVTYQTKWFYERTRGQYLNEKAKLSTAEETKFSLTYPRNQVITKTDAAKYVVAWSQKPHVVSAGAQKNFLAFANDVAAQWSETPDNFNESYFKHLVAKGILFNSLRAGIAKQDWYSSGYLANITAYTVAKISDSVTSLGKNYAFDFDRVWNSQAISQATLDYGLEIGRHVLGVLTAEPRPVVNVTEWAKRDACWSVVQLMDIAVPAGFKAELLDGSIAQSRRRAARATQKIDDGILAQKTVLEIPTEDWFRMQQFAQQRRLLSPKDAGLLALVTRPGRLPSEKQALALLQFRDRLTEHGLDY